MPNMTQLPLWASGDLVHAVVETPRHARVKLSYDGGLECFVYTRALMLGLSYPYDWGFLPSTLGEDGDPLDVLILHEAETYPGVVLRCSIIGGLKVSQTAKGKKQRNDRFIAVPQGDHRARDLTDIDALSKTVRFEIERFFTASVATENKTLNFLGWVKAREAMALIRAGEKAMQEKVRS